MVNARLGRCPDWNYEETMLLVNLKEEAFLKHEEGREVWVQIAEKFSNTPGISAKSYLQCQRRWDTLRKVYLRIQDYCLEAGKNDRQLDGEELMRSMKPKLATAYHEDWYNIVRRVCSQQGMNIERKNPPTLEKPSKRLKLDPSHPALLPQPTGPGIGVLSVTSTSTSGAVIGPLYTYYEASTSVDRKTLVMSHVDTEKVKKLEVEIERLKRELQQQTLTKFLEVKRLNREKEDLVRQVLQLQHGHNTRQIEDFSCFTCLQRTPYIRVEELGGLSSDLIPHDMSFFMSPRQSSHGQRFGATIPSGEWTNLGNDGAEFGQNFSNMCLMTSTSASLPFTPQTKEFNESLGTFDSILGTQTSSSSASKPISGCRWCVLKLFVWACLHFSSSLIRIRRRNPSRTGLSQVMLEEISSDANSRFKGIFPRKNGMEPKWVTETLRSPDGKKVWLGSYMTPEQAARAFDAGKFYFSTTVESDYNFPETPGILLPFINLMDQLPVSEQMSTLQQLATYYADMGDSLSEIIHAIPKINCIPNGNELHAMYLIS